MYDLAIKYYYGENISKSESKAKMLFKKAAALGNTDAKKALDIIN